VSLAQFAVTCQGGDVTFEFVAGNLALDFVATVAEWTSTRLERLPDPAALGEWLADGGLLDAPVRATQRDLEQARTERAALYAVVRALIDGEPPPARELEVVNAAAARTPPVVRVDREGRVHREGDVAAALSAIARSGLELFDLPDHDVIRWCADASCTRAFIDRSRGHRRRWCGMAGCGDRAKAAAYRRRRREHPSGTT
jgi:predicted RNA-binding Zn ribbon-like protein